MLNLFIKKENVSSKGWPLRSHKSWAAETGQCCQEKLKRDLRAHVHVFTAHISCLHVCSLGEINIQYSSFPFLSSFPPIMLQKYCPRKTDTPFPLFFSHCISCIFSSNYKTHYFLDILGKNTSLSCDLNNINSWKNTVSLLLS